MPEAQRTQVGHRPHICHGYHGLYLWRKICHVEKFQISVKNLNNLWSFIEIYAVFVLNLCGEKSVWRKSVWRKICVDKICVEKKWQIWGLFGIFLEYTLGTPPPPFGNTLFGEKICSHTKKKKLELRAVSDGQIEINRTVPPIMVKCYTDLIFVIFSPQRFSPPRFFSTKI